MGWISDLLGGIPTAAVAHERIALLETKFADLETENRQLKQEVDRLTRENATLRGQLPADDFVASRGVLFKRKADGTFEPDAYCPECRRALSTPADFFPPHCSRCHFSAPFKRNDIPAIIRDLAG